MFNPYSIEEIKGLLYVKVITYNPKLWYPWGHAYIGKAGYPVKLDMLEYAKKFDTKEEAETFIQNIYN